MKKQILYPKFITRLFATMLDLCILSIFLTPFMNWVAYYSSINVFHDYFLKNNVNTGDLIEVFKAIRTPEFFSQLTFSNSITYFGILFFVNTAIWAIYFITFWKKYGATPGKYIMRMKIVNIDDYSHPSTMQLVKRFFGYITILLGIWSMIFNKQKLATHDKIAGTVVIKS